MATGECFAESGSSPPAPIVCVEFSEAVFNCLAALLPLYPALQPSYFLALELAARAADLTADVGLAIRCV